MQLQADDSVIVNIDRAGILIVSFLEAIYDDEQNAVQAQSGVDKCFAVIAEMGVSTPAKVIVDLRPMGSKSHISPKAREVYMKFIADRRVGKVAVLGSSDAQVSIANFVLTFTEQIGKKLSWFSNEAEAKYWIQK